MNYETAKHQTKKVNTRQRGSKPFRQSRFIPNASCLYNMGKDPAFLFYSSDFLTGTMLFTDEQVGKYIRLLCLQHQKGHLSEKDIIKICGGIDEDILSKFIKDNSGLYYNERLENEIVKRVKYSESRSKNRNSKKHMSNISKTYVEHMENENEIVNENINVIEDKDVIKNNSIYKDVIDDLNIIMGTQYKYVQKTKELIQARVNEGFTIEDFKLVHRKMKKNWGTDNKMCKYLRPITLYSNKFESYLNMHEENTRFSEVGMKNIITAQALLQRKGEL